MNPAPPVTSTLIGRDRRHPCGRGCERRHPRAGSSERLDGLGKSTREAASLSCRPTAFDPLEARSHRRRSRRRPATNIVSEAVRILVLTTSYPRDANDVAGTFVRDSVEALSAAGVEVRRRLARELPPLRHRLRRRDRQQPTRGAVEGRGAAALPPRVRSRSAAGGARQPTSSTRTGCRARSPRSRRGSRSCSSSGARTSPSRAAYDRSRGGSSGARGSSSARRRPSPRTRAPSARGGHS